MQTNNLLKILLGLYIISYGSYSEAGGPPPPPPPPPFLGIPQAPPPPPFSSAAKPTGGQSLAEQLKEKSKVSASHETQESSGAQPASGTVQTKPSKKTDTGVVSQLKSELPQTVTTGATKDLGFVVTLTALRNPAKYGLSPDQATAAWKMITQQNLSFKNEADFSNWLNTNITTKSGGGGIYMGPKSPQPGIDPGEIKAALQKRRKHSSDDEDEEPTAQPQSSKPQLPAKPSSDSNKQITTLTVSLKVLSSSSKISEV